MMSPMALAEGLARAWLDALRFLTRFPVPALETEPPEDEPSPYAPHPWVMALFPAVGLLLGGVLLTASMGFGWLLPKSLTDVLLLAVLALLSGAIHWDGLIDSADALGVPGARRAEVMKDVHAGSFGLLAAVFLVAIQWSALSSLSGWMHGAALLLFPLWGRWVMVAVCWRMTDLRAGKGLAAVFLARLSSVQLAGASGFALLVSVLLLGVFRGMILALVMGCAAMGIRWAIRRIFGGISGDPIGAACILGEAAALIVATALP